MSLREKPAPISLSTYPCPCKHKQLDLPFICVPLGLLFAIKSSYFVFYLRAVSLDCSLLGCFFDPLGLEISEFF